MAQERRKGGRRRSDKQQARDTSVTFTHERTTGSIEHDERGDARWVSASEKQARDTAETFDELRALDNDTLEILELQDAPRQKSVPGGGYNPYDISNPKKRASKNRR